MATFSFEQWLEMVRESGIFPRITPSAMAAWDLIVGILGQGTTSRSDDEPLFSDDQIATVLSASREQGIDEDDINWALAVMGSMSRFTGITKPEDVALVARTHRARIFKKN